MMKCSRTPALTTALLGFISEDAIIEPRTGKLGTKRRRGEDETPVEERMTSGLTV